MKLFLKLSIAAAFLYWLTVQGKLDFSLVTQLLIDPSNWILALLLLILQQFISTYRWKLLIDMKDNNLSFKRTMAINWIGQFFSTFMLGAITGDLVKIVYAKSSDRRLTKKYLFFTIFLDRLLGLSGLLFIAGFSSLVYYNDLALLGQSMEQLIYVNIFLLAGTIIFLTVLFLKKNWQLMLMRFIPSERLKSLAVSFWSIGENKLKIVSALLISIISHIVIITAFWVVNKNFFETEVDFKLLFAIVPFGQLTVAVPISPAGLGVGHVAYAKLFQFADHHNGASLFNVFWITVAFINLLGIIPYLFMKKVEVKKDDLISD